MTVQYVDGVACYNCSDVERAKKAALEQQTKASDPLHPPTVVPVASGPQASGTNQPLSDGPRGTTLNLLL